MTQRCTCRSNQQMKSDAWHGHERKPPCDAADASITWPFDGDGSMKGMMEHMQAMMKDDQDDEGSSDACTTWTTCTRKWRAMSKSDGEDGSGDGGRCRNAWGQSPHGVKNSRRYSFALRSRSCALSATMIVLSDMSTAPTAGLSTIPSGCESARQPAGWRRCCIPPPTRDSASSFDTSRD